MGEAAVGALFLEIVDDTGAQKPYRRRVLVAATKPVPEVLAHR
jgi:hypothetical protein